MMYQANAPLFGKDDQLAKLLMAQQPDYSQMKDSPLQGLAAALGQIGSAYFGKKKMEADRADTAATLKGALDLGNGSAAGLDPSTGINWETARAPDRNAMANLLMGNPNTAPMAERMILGDMDRKQALEDKIAELKATMPYELQMARAKASISAGSSPAPAAIQVANAIQKAIKEGNYDYANLLAQSAKTVDRGVNPYSATGTAGTMEGYGDATSSIQGMIAQAKQRNQKNVDLEMNPLIAAAEKEAGVLGEEQGKAKAAMPIVEGNASETKKLLDELVNHPGMPGAVGAKNEAQLFGALDSPIAGTKEAGFKARLDQVQGKQFLTAIDTMRGTGAISNVEGQAAKDAVARMSTAQSEEEFKNAAKDYKRIIDKGVGMSKAKTNLVTPRADLKSKYGLE